MTKDNDILLDGEFSLDGPISLSGKTNVEEEYSNDYSKLNEAEISGKINEFIRFMMNEPVWKVNSEVYADMAMYLAGCYHQEYRHSYYNISAEIYAYWDRSEEQLNNLTSNIETLKKIIMKTHKNDELVLKGMNKFFDHVMLEIVRLTDHQKNINNINNIIDKFREDSNSSFKKQDLSILQTVANFENKFGEANKIIEEQKTEMEDIAKSAKKLKKKVKTVYSQFVSILGIFSAIVIVFFGGTTVFSSVLTNIHEAKWNQIGFGISFVGLILFNIIFMFLYILSKYLDVTISTKEFSSKKYTIFKWIDKYPYVFWFNFFCLLIMFLCT